MLLGTVIDLSRNNVYDIYTSGYPWTNGNAVGHRAERVSFFNGAYALCVPLSACNFLLMPVSRYSPPLFFPHCILSKKCQHKSHYQRSTSIISRAFLPSMYMDRGVRVLTPFFFSSFFFSMFPGLLQLPHSMPRKLYSFILLLFYFFLLLSFLSRKIPAAYFARYTSIYKHNFQSHLCGWLRKIDDNCVYQFVGNAEIKSDAAIMVF